MTSAAPLTPFFQGDAGDWDGEERFYVVPDGPGQWRVLADVLLHGEHTIGDSPEDAIRNFFRRVNDQWVKESGQFLHPAAKEIWDDINRD